MINDDDQRDDGDDSDDEDDHNYDKDVDNHD
jgi:hypothetical protein